MCTRGFGALTHTLCRITGQTSLPKWWHKSVRDLPRRWFGQPAACTHPHLLQQGEVTPGITKQEYFTRRCRLMYKIMCAEGHPVSNKHVVIIPSATKQYMTEDIPYPFRQNSNFVYLCGFQEPDSILVLESGDAWPKHTATLFVPKKDPHKELWEGARSGTDGAIELTGVDSAYNIEDLGKYLQMCENTNESGVMWYDSKNTSHHVPHMKCVKAFVEKYQSGSVQNPNLLIQLLRVLKSPAEAALMQQSCDISSEAFKKVMAYSHPGVNEAHLYAKMDFECRVNGAEFLAYPPVVAGGNRANTIHYISNNQLIYDGEMVLMDAGGEYHGYASDITRTWPVSGKFTSVQRLLYESLLEVQLGCIEYLRNTRPISIDTLYQHMLSELGQQLRQLAILPAHMSSCELAQAARRFCPHHVGHYLGMDVHDTDTLSRHVSLQDSMAITVEPGIYIPDTMKDVPEEFRGNGLRIEDDILMTDDGPIVLSDKCPKHPDDIEKYISA